MTGDGSVIEVKTSAASLVKHRAIKATSKIYDYDDVSPFALDKALYLEDKKVQEAERLRQAAYVQTGDAIATEVEATARSRRVWNDTFQTSLASRLEDDAFIYDGRSFIRSDRIPAQFIPIALEHEVMEVVYGSFEAQRDRDDIITKLGLSGFCRDQPNEKAHFVAMVHELNKANQLGLLDQWLVFRDVKDQKEIAGCNSLQRVQHLVNQQEARQYTAGLIRTMDTKK